MPNLKAVVQIVVASLAVTSANAGGAADFHFPTTGIGVDKQALLLAIDDVSWPLKRDLCYYLSKPEVRKEPVLAPNRDNPKSPDYIATHFYGTVLHDEGKFRMWYYPVSHGDQLSDIKQGPVCYAESDDGLSWVRPNLGQVEYKGSKQNNAIKLTDEPIEGVNLIKDEDDSETERRYKMVYNAYDGRKFSIRTAISADGIHWKPQAFIRDKFLEQAGFIKYNGLYLIHGQAIETGEGGSASGRQGYVWVSPDFDRWLPASGDAFLLPEPGRAKDRGADKPYDQVHLGVAPAGFGNVCVGLYGIWHNYPGDTSRKIPASWFGFEQISCDLGLVVSNDGIQFREPVKHHVYLSREDSPVTPLEGKRHPTILIQASGILNVGDQTRIYHGRWRNAIYGMDYWGEVALATLPRDRWGALGLSPRATDGELWSAPVRLPASGCDVILNAENAASSMRVEIAGERFDLLPEYSASKAGRTDLESGLDCHVRWPAGDLAGLGGKTVRFRIHLEKKPGGADPRLYAIYLRSK